MLTAETESSTTHQARSLRHWAQDIVRTIAEMRSGPVFGLLLISWLLLFHFIGNSTFGYVKTPSLFAWMDYVYGMGPDDRHGYYIPFVVLGLLWWKRAELQKLPKRPWLPGLLVVAFSLVIHMIGLLVQQTRLSIGGFYFGIWGLVATVWGPSVLRATFFPFCLLIFAIPLMTIADQLTFPLRQLATEITVGFANVVLGIHVKQQGTSIFDPSGRYSYEVAAACSGLRSLTAIFALTTVYAFVFFQRAWKRCVIVLLAFPLAVASNVLRLLTIIVASDAFSAHAGHAVHESTWMSLVPYIVAFGGILLAGRAIKEDAAVDVLQIGACVGVAVALFAIPHELYLKLVDAGLPQGHGPDVVVGLIAIAAAWIFCLQRRSWRVTHGWAWATGALTLALIGGSLSVFAAWKSTQRLSPPGVRLANERIFAISPTNEVLAGTNIVALPHTVLTYRSDPLPLSSVVYEWLPKDTTYGQRRYKAPDEFTIDNLVVLMGSDRTSIHKPQYCITGQGYQIVSEVNDRIRVEKPSPYDLPVKKLHFKGEVWERGHRATVNGVFVYWFVSDTEVTSEHGARMWQLARDLIRTGVLRRWAYVICIAYCEPGREDAAYFRLKQFITASVPEFQLTPGGAAGEVTSLAAQKSLR